MDASFISFLVNPNYFKLFLISEVSLHQFSTAFWGGASLAPHTLHAPHPPPILYHARHTHRRPRILPTTPTVLGRLFYSTIRQSCGRSSRMSCMLAFMTEGNYQAVAEVNGAVAAPIGEQQLEVESGGVKGEREARLMRRETVVSTWKSVLSFACSMYMFFLHFHVFLVRYDQEAGTRWWPFWWANTRAGGGLDAFKAAHGRVCPQLAKSRIPLTHADGFK